MRGPNGSYCANKMRLCGQAVKNHDGNFEKKGWRNAMAVWAGMTSPGPPCVNRRLGEGADWHYRVGGSSFRKSPTDPGLALISPVQDCFLAFAKARAHGGARTAPRGDQASLLVSQKAWARGLVWGRFLPLLLYNVPLCAFSFLPGLHNF